MATRNLKMKVSGVSLDTPDDALNYDKQKEAELAPPVTIAPAPVAPAPEDPSMEVSQAPASMAPPPPLPVIPPPKPPPPDYTRALLDAQERARQGHLAVNLGRAGQAAITAVTGAKDDGLFSSLDSQADAPVKDLQNRIAFEKDADARRKAAEAADPNSPTSRVAQEAFRRALPRAAAQLGNLLPGMTADQLEGFTKTYTGQQKFDDTREKWQSDEARRNAEFGPQQQVRQQNANTAEYAAHHPKPMVSIEEKSVPIDERLDISRMDKLGGETTKFAQYHAALQALDQAAPGLIHGRVPDNYPLTPEQRLFLKDPTGLAGRFFKINPEAQRVDQALKELIDLTARDRSGAVLNAAEMARYEKMIRDGVAAGPEQTAIAVNALRKAVAEKLHQRQTSYQQPAPHSSRSPYDMFKANGGLTFEAPEFADEQVSGSEPAPPPAPPAEPPQAASPGPHPVATKSEVAEPSRPPPPAGFKRVMYPGDPTHKTYLIPANKVGTDGSVEAP